MRLTTAPLREAKCYQKGGPSVCLFLRIRGYVSARSRPPRPKFSPERNADYKSNMIRRIFFVIVFSSIASMVTVYAEPPAKKKKSHNTKTSAASNVTPSTPLVGGWTLTNGTWVHPDGYKYVNGSVIRTGTQTHKPPPKPPTQAQLDSVKKKSAPPTPADAAAAKAAERERNLAPRPAPQTGTHL